MSYLIITLTLLVSIGISSIVIPNIIKFAFKKRLFDEHNERKIHTGAVPRLGGVAFFPVALFTMAIVVALIYLLANKVHHTEDLFIAHFVQSDWITDIGPSVLLGLCAVMILYASGIIDDLKGLRYREKFMTQIAAGILVCLSGIYIKDLHGIFFLHEIPVWAGWCITIFAIVFITNAINFIDGIDGLASSICSIALLYYAVSFAMFGRMGYAMFAISILGAVLPFLWYNVFGTAERHNKIFMGDTGSLFLGLVLAALGTVLNNFGGEMTGECVPNAFVFAFAPLAVPCYDVLRVVLHRVRNHRNAFKPDRNHFHHKLMDCGLGQHGALGVLLLVDAVMIVFTLVSSMFVEVNLVLVVSLICWSLLSIYLSRVINRRNKNVETN